MQSTTLSFENMHNHGELFANILRARRQSFIVQKGWNLPQAMGMEYDQYDTPASRATSRMWSLSPRISWMTSTPARVPAAAGRAT